MEVSAKKKVAPLLRFTQYTENWKVRQFGDLYSFYSTNSLSRDKLNYEEGVVKNIHYGDIHKKFQPQFLLSKELVPFINNDVDLSKVKEDSYCQNGDLVMADASEDYSDIGKTIELIDLNNEKVLAGLHTFLARPTSTETQIGFTGFLLKSWKVKKQIMTIAQGTKVLSLSTGRVSNLQLNIPTLPEQQKIASFLTTVDTKIQQLTKKKSLLEEYKKGVMQQLFSQEIRFTPRLEDLDLPEGAVADLAANYPDWEEKKLGELIEICSSKRVLQKDWKEEGIPFYRTREIINLSEQKAFRTPIFIAEELFKSIAFKYGVPKKGDLLVTGVGTIGRTYLVQENDKFYFKDGNVIWFKMNDKINSIFLSQQFKTRYLRKQLSDNASITTVATYTIEGARKTIVLFPCIEEQQRIATFLSGIDKKIELVNTQLEQTQQFKKGLLQQMFV